MHDHNERQRQDYIAQLLQEGKSIALVSDAGTPLISDPGFHLVRHCRSLNLPVSPLPGACAAIAALSVAEPNKVEEISLKINKQIADKEFQIRYRCSSSGTSLNGIVCSC